MNFGVNNFLMFPPLKPFVDEKEKLFFGVPCCCRIFPCDVSGEVLEVFKKVEGKTRKARMETHCRSDQTDRKSNRKQQNNRIIIS